MFLEQRQQFFTPAQFGLATAGCLGTSQKFPIDRTWPIEEIVIAVNFTVSVALTLVTTINTPDNYDNILTILQHVNLSVNDGKQPRSVVDCDGVSLLEYATLAGDNLDEASQRVIALGQRASFPTGAYSLTYRIPMVEQYVGEPLRSRMYLPVHLYPQDPVLTLTFQNAATMYSAGTILTLTCDVLLIRRVPTKESEMLLRKTAGTNPSGYIDFDLIETPFSVAPGIGTEQRFPLPIPGEYGNLMFRSYLGGASPITRNVIDASGIGDTVANGFGSETRWRLESGLVVVREWRWRHLRMLSEWQRPIFDFVSNPGGLFVAASSGGAVTTALAFKQALIGGDFIASTGFRAANSVMMNFATDGVSGDNANELGSLLDCNTPANNGLKMEIIGTPANVATNASYLKVMGRRFFGDLRKWQKFA